MSTSEFNAHSKGRCYHLQEIGWDAYYGTTISGNLPQYKPEQNPFNIDISQIIMPGVSIEDFRPCHMTCPYSTQSDYHYVRDDNPFSSTYRQLCEISDDDLVDHTVTSGIMIRYNRGSKYGYLCVDPNCPYYQGTVSGIEGGSWYFYV